MGDRFKPYLSGDFTGQGSVLITKDFAGKGWQTLAALAKLPLLPNALSNYKFTEAQYPIEINGKKVSAKLPKVNEILTAYCNECLQTYSTIEFIEIVDQQDFPAYFVSFRNLKLEYAINLFNNIYNLPFTSNAARDVLSYYFEDTFNFLDLNPDSATKLSNLKASLKEIETKYTEKLIKEVLPNTVFVDGKPLDAAGIKWLTAKNEGKVLDQTSAEWFIKRANREMEIDIDVHFAEAQIKARMFNADPVISDPRFRMSIEDARWNEYDETIKKEVAFYNRKFAGVGNFVPLDWRYVKAMIWTEVMAGPKGNPTQWTNLPMQIGRFTQDRGYAVVSGKAANQADLEKMNFVSPQLVPEVQNRSSVVGQLNVRAGIAYLYHRAIDEVGAAADKIADFQILTGAVGKNEGLDAIARRLGTTTNNIMINNPGIDSGSLQPGQPIKYQKAAALREIKRWKDWRQTIRGYNGDAEWEINPKTGARTKKKGTSGDPDYLPKLDLAYQIITSRQ